MIKLNSISPRNTMAISAMLMLSAGTAFAQDATIPVTDAPVVAAPAPPAIVIPVPEPVASPVASPVTSTAPAPAATTAPVRQPVARDAAKPATSTPVTRTTATRNVAPAPAGDARPQAGPATSPVVTPTTPPVTETGPVDETGPVAPPPGAAADDSNAPDWALPVGAAATLLVLGGVGLAMSRRRRPYEEDVDFVPPVATRPTLRTQPERRVAPPPPPMQPSATALAPTPVAGTPGERAALIEHIVASPPDAANPFVSRKARRRRARIMVQSMAARSDVPTSGPVPGDPAIARNYASA